MNGKVFTQAQLLKEVKADDRIRDIDFQDLKVVSEGNDVAVLSGTVVSIVERWRGKIEAVKYQFTDRFSRASGEWQLLSSEASTVKK